MYEFRTRVRYTELDEYGKLSVGSLVDLLQDTSTFQSEYLHVGCRYLQEKGLVWMVSFWQIVIDRMPDFLEEVVVGTSPYGFTPAFGLRNFVVKEPQGNYLVRANSYWVLIDRKSQKPIRIPKEEAAPYGCEPPIDMEYAPRKLQVTEELQPLEPIVVRRHHLDTNLHVNNGQYIKIALECLPANLEIGELRVEYRKQALLGDCMVPYVGESSKRYVVKLCNKEGVPYTVIAFYKRAEEEQKERRKEHDSIGTNPGAENTSY